MKPYDEIDRILEGLEIPPASASLEARIIEAARSLPQQTQSCQPILSRWFLIFPLRQSVALVLTILLGIAIGWEAGSYTQSVKPQTPVQMVDMFYGEGGML